MGDEHGLTLPDVQEDVQNHFYDALLHCGDLAYDLWKEEGQVHLSSISPHPTLTPTLTLALALTQAGGQSSPFPTPRTVRV